MKLIKSILASLTIMGLIFVIINLIFRKTDLSPFYIFTLFKNAFYNIEASKFLVLYLSIYIFPIIIGFIFSADLNFKTASIYMGIALGADLLIKVIVLVFVLKNLNLYLTAPMFIPEFLGLLLGASGLALLKKVNEKTQYIVLSAAFAFFGILNFLRLNRYKL